jgi:hypothetical protein
MGQFPRAIADTVLGIGVFPALASVVHPPVDDGISGTPRHGQIDP